MNVFLIAGLSSECRFWQAYRYVRGRKRKHCAKGNLQPKTATVLAENASSPRPDSLGGHSRSVSFWQVIAWNVSRAARRLHLSPTNSSDSRKRANQSTLKA